MTRSRPSCHQENCTRPEKERDLASERENSLVIKKVHQAVPVVEMVTLSSKHELQALEHGSHEAVRSQL